MTKFDKQKDRAEEKPLEKKTNALEGFTIETETDETGKVVKATALKNK